MNTRIQKSLKLLLDYVYIYIYIYIYIWQQVPTCGAKYLRSRMIVLSGRSPFTESNQDWVGMNFWLPAAAAAAAGGAVVLCELFVWLFLSCSSSGSSSFLLAVVVVVGEVVVVVVLASSSAPFSSIFLSTLWVVMTSVGLAAPSGAIPVCWFHAFLFLFVWFC